MCSAVANDIEQWAGVTEEIAHVVELDASHGSGVVLDAACDALGDEIGDALCPVAVSALVPVARHHVVEARRCDAVVGGGNEPAIATRTWRFNLEQHVWIQTIHSNDSTRSK